ncbi:hypothetical protein ACWC5I_43055 [Kitasatospora sp. NPDC001574]
MSDHFHAAAADGLPSLPLPAVTGLLRAVAASWTACPCDNTGCWQAAEPYAASLTGCADQLDIECIAAAGQSAGPTAPTD